MNNLVKTPCVGICSTALGDTVCRGCKRFNHEVVQWNGYTNNEKLIVLDRLSGFLTQVVDYHLNIDNQTHLDDYCVTHQVRGFGNARVLQNNPTVKAYFVLQQLTQGDTIKPELETVGISVKPHYTHLSTQDLFHTLEQAYYELCVAYYDANYLRAFQHESLLKS